MTDLNVCRFDTDDLPESDASQADINESYVPCGRGICAYPDGHKGPCGV